MKKCLGLMLIFFILTTVSIVSAESASRTIIINMDGQFVVTDTNPLLTEEGRMLVPIRALASLGFQSTWDASTKTATVTNDVGDIIRITADNTTAYINGTAVTLDVPAQIIQDRMMVPIRFITEGLGYTVEFEEVRDILFVRSPGYAVDEEVLNSNDLTEARKAAISLPLEADFMILKFGAHKIYNYRFPHGEALRYVYSDSYVNTIVEIRDGRAYVVAQYVYGGAPGSLSHVRGIITEENQYEVTKPFERGTSYLKQENGTGSFTYYDAAGERYRGTYRMKNYGDIIQPLPDKDV